MRAVILLGLSIPLAACVTAQEREQQMARAMEQCSLAKTQFERTRCANEAENRIEGRETPQMAYKHAAALQIAVRQDKGEITKDEAEAEYQMMLARLKMQAAQQARADRANALQGLGEGMQQAAGYLNNVNPTPPMPPPQPMQQPIRCRQVGGEYVCQ